VQSTVFDFSFRLKKVDTQFYILDSVYKIVSFDFSIFIVIDKPRDFSIVSSVRINNDLIEDYSSMQQYCESKKCKVTKSRWYIGGVEGYMSIFGLEKDDGFNYTPDYLMSDSKYDGALVGRLFNNGKFIHNQQRFLLSNGEYYDSISVNTINTKKTKLSGAIELVLISPRESAAIADISELQEIKIGLLTAKNIGVMSGYLKIIENTRHQESHLFHERTWMEEHSYVFSVLNIDAIGRISLGSLLSSTGIHLSASSAKIDELNNFISKYAIISLNKNIKQANSYYSENFRLLANKGVI